VLAPAALAVGSGQGPGSTAQDRINETQPTGTLPFTGLDVTFVAFAALLVVAVGVGIHRLGRDRA
jgi:hypothetical protein